MAANQAAFNNYLQNVLLIDSQAARDAINEQGITAFDDLTHHSDKYVQELFQKIRNPGGLIPNPNANVPAVGAGAAGAADPNAAAAIAAAAAVPAFLPNRGVAIGVNLELRVRQLRYYLFHMYRIQRAFVPAQATLARLERTWALKERLDRMKELNKEAMKVDVLLKIDQVRKVIEDIDELISHHFGAYGAPLSYLVRADEEVDEAEDPGYGRPDALSELVRRTRHDGNQYEEDNMDLWLLIRQATHGGPAWNWTKPFTIAKDGRGAYFALKEHYLGKNFQKRAVAQAEKVLATSYYDGKARNFTFEAYCEKLNMAFQDLEEAGEPPSEGKKVRILLANIRAPELQMTVAHVRGDKELEATFESAMTYIAEQNNTLKQLTAQAKGANRNISAINRGKKNKNKGKGKDKKGNGKGLTRYYTHKEWIKLSKKKQEEIRNARQQKQAAGAKRNASALETNESSTQHIRFNDPIEEVVTPSTGDQMSRRN